MLVRFTCLIRRIVLQYFDSLGGIHWCTEINWCLRIKVLSSGANMYRYSHQLLLSWLVRKWFVHHVSLTVDLIYPNMIGPTCYMPRVRGWGLEDPLQQHGVSMGRISWTGYLQLGVAFVIYWSSLHKKEDKVALLILFSFFFLYLQHFFHCLSTVHI